MFNACRLVLYFYTIRGFNFSISPATTCAVLFLS